MNIATYLDATYLHTTETKNIPQADIESHVLNLINEAIEQQYKAVMIRPEFVSIARQKIDASHSKVLVGTVINFPEGTHELNQVIEEAKLAIEHGAEELDFVFPYQKYKNTDWEHVKDECYTCIDLVLQEGKTIKWILETAALSEFQIKDICSHISQWVVQKYPSDTQRVFLKTSTGFYQTPNHIPNGATPEVVSLMLEYGKPLPVKASGGIRDYETCLQYIEMGVSRIGTSSSLEIVSTSTDSSTQNEL